MKKLLPGEKTAVSPKINTGQSITTDKNTIASVLNKFFVGAATRPWNAYHLHPRLQLGPKTSIT